MATLLGFHSLFTFPLCASWLHGEFFIQLAILDGSKYREMSSRVHRFVFCLCARLLRETTLRSAARNAEDKKNPSLALQNPLPAR